MYSIGPLTCAPGERAEGLIPVGTSTYGVELGIPLIVVNGTEPGPVLCVDARRARRRVRRPGGRPPGRRRHRPRDPARHPRRHPLHEHPRLRGRGPHAAAWTTSTSTGSSRATRTARTPCGWRPPSSSRSSPPSTRWWTCTPAARSARSPRSPSSRAATRSSPPGIGLAAGHELIWKGGKWGGTVRHPTLAAGKPAITIEVGRRHLPRGERRAARRCSSATSCASWAWSTARRSCATATRL